MRNTWLSAMVMFVLMSAGCSQVREPWVSSDEQLAGERSRSAEQAQLLRDRLVAGQNDR